MSNDFNNNNNKYRVTLTDLFSNEKTTFDLVHTKYAMNYFNEITYEQFIRMGMIDSMIPFSLKQFCSFDDIGNEKDEWSILVDNPNYSFILRVTKLHEYLIQNDFDSFPISNIPYTPIYSFG
ncbi:hypothetical protein ACOTE8_12580 [Achromobacter xylosoxidans]|uniref:hypothetical protein n=1 Tax=Alcaligenes xylosoxydans xylosoxydans TaxID=85698 RepID=UPI00105CFF41|nr:hypothetical protein [Achromobacter xylosoxidans]